jgi:hypothetical protein
MLVFNKYRENVYWFFNNGSLGYKIKSLRFEGFFIRQELLLSVSQNHNIERFDTNFICCFL